MRKVKLQEMHYWKVVILGAAFVLSASGTLVPQVLSAEPTPPAANQVDEKVGITDKEILLGSCASLEGPVAVVGKQVVSGAMLYFNYVNSKGGINGRQIKLLSHDDSYDPDKAVQCFERLQAEKVFAGACFVGAPPATKYVRLATTHNFPIVGFYTGWDAIYEPFRHNVIGVRASYSDEALAQVNHLWDVGFRKFAVIYQNDACGAATLEGVKRALKDHGSEIVGQGSFERGSLEVNDAINLVKPNHPEVVVFDGTAPPIVKIIKQCHESGWHPLFSSVSFLPAEAFIKLAGKDAEGTVITQVVPPYDEIQLPTVALYRKLLETATPGQKPTFAQFEGFVDALVVCNGLQEAGRNLTRSNFIKAIESFHNKDIGLGAEFKLNYGPADHKGFDHVCYTIVHNALPVVLKDWKGQLALPAKK
ncbi:MAG: ABC transporter substrate-binding protein [Candidatus Obscuribacterales bacterium]|nr:ABC transporter substrate-binding protein [Candidatus Obscuribacterales bacterium]